MDILLRPRDGQPTVCFVCGLDPLPQGSISFHLKNHHGMTVSQYREKFNIPQRSDHGRGKPWLGKVANNRVYENLKTTVECNICSRKFDVDSNWYHYRIRGGHNRFACPSGVPGKRSDCVKKLQSITIKEKRSTVESRSKTVAQLVRRWSDPEKRARYGAIMKDKPRDWHARRMAAVLKSNASGSMTNPEKTVNDYIIANNLPFKYTGAGDMEIGMLFPDFASTDGSRRLIEVFGCYWHGCQKCFPGSKSKGIPKRQRLSTYKKHGYSCQIIWEHDMDKPNWPEIVGSILRDGANTII